MIDEERALTRIEWKKECIVSMKNENKKQEWENNFSKKREKSF